MNFLRVAQNMLSDLKIPSKTKQTLAFRIETQLVEAAAQGRRIARKNMATKTKQTKYKNRRKTNLKYAAD